MMLSEARRERHMAILHHSDRLRNHYHNPWRNSSQTHKAIKLAIAFMLQGKACLFIHEGRWESPRNEADQQLEDLAVPSKTAMNNRRISCASGGSIQFLNLDDDRFERAQGFQREYVIFDNDHKRRFREGEGDNR